MLTCLQQHDLSLTLMTKMSDKHVCRQPVSVKLGEVL